MEFVESVVDVAEGGLVLGVAVDQPFDAGDECFDVVFVVCAFGVECVGLGGFAVEFVEVLEVGKCVDMEGCLGPSCASIDCVVLGECTFFAACDKCQCWCEVRDVV